MDLRPDIIERNFEAMKPRIEEFSDKVLAHLLLRFPEIKVLLQAQSLDKQRRLLVAGLIHVATHLEDPEFLGEYLGKMGEQLALLHFGEIHLDWMGQCFLNTQKEMFKGQWSPEAFEQWSLVIDLASAFLREGLQRETDVLARESAFVPLRRAS